MAGDFVEVEGLNLHYTDLNPNASGTPLLLLHGLDSSHHTWRHLAPKLAQDRRVIALDMPGFGYASKPLDGVYSVQEMARIVGVFLDALHLDRVVVVGHSIGGAVCDYMARSLDERICGLVLVAGYRLARLGFADMNSKMAGNILLFSYADKNNIDMDAAALQKSFYDSPNLQSLKKRISEDMLNTVPSSMPDASAVPTLVVWGRSDLVLPLEPVGLGSYDDHPGAEMVVVDDAGHAVQEEQPSRTAKAIASFCVTHGL